MRETGKQQGMALMKARMEPRSYKSDEFIVLGTREDIPCHERATRSDFYPGKNHRCPSRTFPSWKQLALEPMIKFRSRWTRFHPINIFP